MLYREAVIKKLERAETHNRLGVDVPLVVSKQPSPGFRAGVLHCAQEDIDRRIAAPLQLVLIRSDQVEEAATIARGDTLEARVIASGDVAHFSEEHTSELQSQSNLVCRLLLEKKKIKNTHNLDLS